MILPCHIMAAAVLLVISHSGLAQTSAIRFSARVEAGQRFTKELPGGLQFQLTPSDEAAGGISGWTITVGPRGERPTDCDDFVWVATPPYRGFNPRYLDTSYGYTAAQAVALTPRGFRFVLNCEDFLAAAARARLLLWPGDASEAELEAAREQLGTTPQGSGMLRIVDSKISPSPSTANVQDSGQIDWITFEVEIHLPER